MEAPGCSTGDSGVSPWVGQGVVSRHVADLNVAVAVRHGEEVLGRLGTKDKSVSPGVSDTLLSYENSITLNVKI